MMNWLSTLTSLKTRMTAKIMNVMSVSKQEQQTELDETSSKPLSIKVVVVLTVVGLFLHEFLTSIM
jgi:hypothetical protein